MSRFAIAALLSALLSLPAVAADAPAAPAAKPMAMMGSGMGQHCKHKGMMAGAGGCSCPRAEALEQRVEALEKRLDLMQATLELLARQQK